MKEYFNEEVGEEYLKLLSNTAAIPVIFGVAFFLITRPEGDFSPVKIFIISVTLIMGFIGAIINAQIFLKRSLKIPEELKTIPPQLKSKERLGFLNSLNLLHCRTKIVYRKYKGLPFAILLCGAPLYISIYVSTLNRGTTSLKLILFY